MNNNFLYQWGQRIKSHQPSGGGQSQYELPTPPPQTQQEKPDPSTWDYRNARTGLNGEMLPPGALGWRPDGSPDFGTGFKGWALSAYNNIQKSWFEGWQEGQQIAEKNEYKTDLMPRWTASWEATKAIGSEALFGVLNTLGLFAIGTKQVAGSAGLALKDMIYNKKDVSEIDWKENWEASRLAYNIVVQGFTQKGDSLRQEFIERMNNGERPDLIAEDMVIKGKASPWVEMGGEAIFDPLNVDLFVNWFGKGRKATTMMNAAKKAFLTPEAKGVADLLEGGLEQAAKQGDEIADAAKFKAAFEAQRAVSRDVSEMVNVLQTPGVLKPVVKKISELPARIRQFSPLIADSRRAALLNRSGEVVSGIVRIVKDPNDVLDVLEAMAKLGGADEQAAEEAFRFLTKQKNARMLFSEAGNELGSILRRTVEEHGDDWFEAINKALGKGGTEEVGAMLMGKLEKVTEELFPAAEKMASAYDLAKTGAQLTPEMKRLADMGEKMRPIERQIARMHAKAQKGVVGKLNRFFVTAYMDWSPAFAFRNGVQNSIQIFLDYGPAAFVKSADNFAEEAVKYNRGMIANMEGYEAGRAVSGGVTGSVVKGKTGVFEAIGAMFSKKSARAASEVFETNGARRIVGHTYIKTFKQGLEPLVAGLSKDKRFAALPPEIFDALKSEIFNNYGDTAKALEAVRSGLDNGMIDLFKNMNNIPSGLRSTLVRVSKDREFIDTVLNAATKKDALKGLDKIFNDLDIASKGVYVETRHAIQGDTFDDLAKYLEDYGVATSTADRIVSIQRQVNNEVMARASEVLGQVDNWLQDVVRQGANPVDVKTLKQKYKLTSLTEWGSETSDQLGEMLKGVRDTFGVLKEERVLANQIDLMNKSWAVFSKAFDLTGPRPQSIKDFISAVWDGFKSTQARTWSRSRETSLLNIPAYFDEVDKIAGVPIPPEMRAAVDDAIQEAQKWSQASIGEFGVLVNDGFPVLGGTKRTQIAQIARYYGIASRAEKGAVLDEKVLLKIINKYGKAGIESLDDPVSLELVNRALADYAKKEAAGIDELSKVTGIKFGGNVPEHRLQILASKYGVGQEDILSVVNKFLAGEYTGEAIPSAKRVMEYSDVSEDLLRESLRARLVSGEGAIPKGMGLEDFYKFLDESQGAAARAGETLRGATTQVAPELARAIPEPAPLVPPYQQGTLPSYARGLFEGNLDQVHKLLTDYVNENFGKVKYVAKNPEMEKALLDMAPDLEKRLEEVRVVSSRVAQEARNFTLLNYGQRTYMDLASAYLFPFGFWYKGTYNNWLNRIVTNPAIIAGYGKYKRAMAEHNAGLPDWWKQNIKVDSILGIDLKQPLFFNLEATLGPLKGITGEDFNDPQKRVDWWTYTLDQLGKFGPSTWTPLSMATAMILRNKGETEASDRWMGRILPQTALVKTLTGKELDPAVGWMMGGYDPYERRRIGRALGEMVVNDPSLKEEAIQAAHDQSGPLWEAAVKNSNALRAGGQAMSTLFGVGFKARTQSDMEIDQFDSEYRYLMTMSRGGYIDSDTFRQQMALLGEKYPFMDTVLISRRGGPDKDIALAYNVLSRIPPGDASGLLEAVGVNNDVVNRFYDEKGDMSKWTEGDRERFMAAIVDMSAIIKMPDLPTKQEWNAVRTQYKEMRTEVARALGEDIWDKMDAYYAAKDKGKGEEYLAMHPEVSQAFDLKNAYVVNNDLMNTYYGGIDTIEGYYKAQGRAMLEKKYGANIQQVVDGYYNIYDYKEKRKYLRDHPELKKYWDDKAKIDDWILQATIRMGVNLEDKPMVELRDAQSETQTKLGEMMNQRMPTPEQFEAVLGPNLSQLIQMMYASGEELPKAATSELDYLAPRLGYTNGDDLFRDYLISLQR